MRTWYYAQDKSVRTTHEAGAGWGIAASPTELYLTGGTASAYWEGYPLKQFSTSSDLDFYQDINFGGDAYSFLDYYQFE